jgi:hypothetical protein
MSTKKLLEEFGKITRKHSKAELRGIKNTDADKPN